MWGANGAEEWYDGFGCKLAYKQKHHAMTHTGEQPDTYKKGLFLVFVKDRRKIKGRRSVVV
jgi:hypothetical protein